MGLLLKRQGHKPSQKQRWDHNAITPGTPFMDALASYCRTWAAKAVARQPSPARYYIGRVDAGRGRAQDHGSYSENWW